MFRYTIDQGYDIGCEAIWIPCRKFLNLMHMAGTVMYFGKMHPFCGCLKLCRTEREVIARYISLKNSYIYYVM